MESTTTEKAAGPAKKPVGLNRIWSALISRKFAHKNGRFVLKQSCESITIPDPPESAEAKQW